MSAVPKSRSTPQLSSVAELRQQARKHIEEGAVTDAYQANREKVVELLNDALATELVCVLRYRHDYFVARGIHSHAVAAEFLAHSNEELGHADRLAERIVQLGGEPHLDPSEIASRSHSEYRIGKTLAEAIKENLIAERIAIDSYREMVQYVGESDSTTRRMLEEILAVEEEHADELADLLQGAAAK